MDGVSVSRARRWKSARHTVGQCCRDPSTTHRARRESLATAAAESSGQSVQGDAVRADCAANGLRRMVER